MPSGSQSVLQWKFEGTTYGGAVVAAQETNGKPFGYGSKITSLERANNMERIFGLGSRTAQVILPKQFAGSFSVETVYSDPRILWAIMGDGSAAVSATNPLATADRYLDSNYEDADAGAGLGVNGYTISTASSEAKIQPSFKMYNSIDATTDYVETIDGCMINTATISASVGEPVLMTMDGFFKSETLATSGLFTSPTQYANVVPYSFGQLQFPNNTANTVIQSFELTVNNNIDGIYGLGDRRIQTKAEKQREYEIRATVYFDDPTKFLAYAYTGASGGTTPDTTGSTILGNTVALQLVFTNTAAGTKSTSLEATTINFTNARIDTHSLPQDVTAPIMEDIVFIADTATVKVLNSTFANFLAAA